MIKTAIPVCQSCNRPELHLFHEEELPVTDYLAFLLRLRPSPISLASAERA